MELNNLIKIGRAEGGFDVYRRKMGDQWEEASLSDFNDAMKASQA